MYACKIELIPGILWGCDIVKAAEETKFLTECELDGVIPFDGGWASLEAYADGQGLELLRFGIEPGRQSLVFIDGESRSGGWGRKRKYDGDVNYDFALCRGGRLDYNDKAREVRAFVGELDGEGDDGWAVHPGYDRHGGQHLDRVIRIAMKRLHGAAKPKRFVAPPAPPSDPYPNEIGETFEKWKSWFRENLHQVRVDVSGCDLDQIPALLAWPSQFRRLVGKSDESRLLLDDRWLRKFWKEKRRDVVEYAWYDEGRYVTNRHSKDNLRSAALHKISGIDKLVYGDRRPLAAPALPLLELVAARPEVAVVSVRALERAVAELAGLRSDGMEADIQAKPDAPRGWLNEFRGHCGPYGSVDPELFEWLRLDGEQRTRAEVLAEIRRRRKLPVKKPRKKAAKPK